MTSSSSSPNNFLARVKSQIGTVEFTWKTAQDYGLLLLGALVQAFAMRLFLVPGQLVSGGISGAAQIITHFVNFPIGVMVLIGNIPLIILGWRYLGGPRFAIRTAVAVAAFAIFTDVLIFFIPSSGVTTDNVLNSLFGGVFLGVGLGSGLPRAGHQRRIRYPGAYSQSSFWHLHFTGLSHHRHNRCVSGWICLLLGKSALRHGGHLRQRHCRGDDL